MYSGSTQLDLLAGRQSPIAGLGGDCSRGLLDTICNFHQVVCVAGVDHNRRYSKSNQDSLNKQRQSP